MQVKNKRVVVTGAASGIGKALAVAFKKAGAQSVIAVDINMEGAEETAKDVDGIAVKANVGQESDILNVIPLRLVSISCLSFNSDRTNRFANPL